MMKPTRRFSDAFLVLGLIVIFFVTLMPAPSFSQIRMGGDKKKKEEEEKPQYPRKRFSGTISTVKLEERRFLLSTPDGLAILVQVNDKTKIRHKKEKKGEPDVIFADLKPGDSVEVDGELPPSRILEAIKIYLETPAKK